MERMCKVLTILVMSLSVGAASLPAANIRGQLTSDLYLTEDDGRKHIRPYESLRADLRGWQGPDGKFLLVHTYFRWTTDLSHKRANDPQTYIYDNYLLINGVPKGAACYVGRQFVYNATGSALLDGVRIKYSPVRQFQMDVFGGSSVSQSNPEKVQSLTDFGTLGGRLSFRRGYSAQIGINWMLRRSGGHTVAHRAGLDFDLSFSLIKLYGKLTYDVANLRAGEVLARASYAAHLWYLSGEFSWREPSVSSNSLFSLIDSYGYKETRMDIQRRVWRRMSAVAQIHAGFFENDESWRTGIGLRSDNFSLLWRHQEGYGGKYDGLYGTASVRIARRWEVYAGANLGRYRVQELQQGLNDAYTGRLGILWRAGHGMIAQGEGQYLRNGLQDHDFRVNLRLSADFSLGDNGGGGSF